MKFQGRKLRHEHKYYLHTHEYLMLRQRLSSVLKLDPHSVSPEGYGIRSLYFDGPLNSAVYDKANGIFSRDKYRIRIYNGGSGSIKLERKSKFGDYVCKESAALSLEEYRRIMDGDYQVIQDRQGGMIQDFYRALLGGFRPVVIVDYQREAYLYGPGDVRITFDKKLSAGINTVDLFDPELILRETFDSEKTILEVKFDAFLPDLVRVLVQPAAHNRSAISKYLICRESAYKHFKTL